LERDKVSDKGRSQKKKEEEKRVHLKTKQKDPENL